MASVKTVRLRSTSTGVVVQTSEENASRLSGFEPAESKASTRKSSNSK